MKAAFLPDRGIVKVSGDDARNFLNGLLSGNMDLVRPGIGVFCALLTPQGKITVDGIVTEVPQGHGGGFLIDCPKALAPFLVSRLDFYKLRAKITVEDISDNLGVIAVWDTTEPPDLDLAYADPRTDRLGWRVLMPPELADKAIEFLGADAVGDQAYDAHRIELGIPQGGIDFSYGATFPHEANMDKLHGIDFDKGCYIGQEVVSRVEHRGTARTRIVRVTLENRPDAGAEVMAGDKHIGTMGSSTKGLGLAQLRLDRVADALAAGREICTDDVFIAIHPDDLPQVVAMSSGSSP